jgi:hypothetical protein
MNILVREIDMDNLRKPRWLNEKKIWKEKHYND